MGILLLILNILSMALNFSFYLEYDNNINMLTGMFNLLVIGYMLINIDDLLD